MNNTFNDDAMKELLKNDTIRLRAIEPEDMEKFYEWENETELWKFGSSIAPFSRFCIKQYIIASGQDIYQRKQLRLMIETTDGKEIVGTVDLYDFNPFHQRAGVGILIDKVYQNKGYALKTLDLLDYYGFEFLKINQLYAFVSETNEKSIALFKKAGYRETGKLRQWISVEEKFVDTLVLQRIKNDYLLCRRI